MSAFLSEQKLKSKKDDVCLRNKDDKNQKVFGMGPWAEYSLNKYVID